VKGSFSFLAIGSFFLLSLTFILSRPIFAEASFLFPAEFWYGQGFTLSESAEIIKEGKKEPNLFRVWLDQQTKKKRSKIIAILLSKGIKFKNSKEKKEKDELVNPSKTKSELGPVKNKELNEDFFFVGGSYQVLDLRNIPLDKRNHSSLLVGRMFKLGKLLFEKRDEHFVYSAELQNRYFYFSAGNRYKPLPNFYFAKDPNFFSNFDKKDSFLPQPLTESYFLGMYLFPSTQNFLFGVYSAKNVSEEPGFYLVNQNKSYAATLSGQNKIGSLFINDKFRNVFGAGWNLNLQGEAQGKTNNYVGFFYLRGLSDNNRLKIDLTGYRDNQLLLLSTNDSLEKNGVKQDLAYARIRYREYYVLETLSSTEGLRYESGYGVHLPFLYGEWGAFIFRYRDYTEDGFYVNRKKGYGLFYEYRDLNTVFSIGAESRDKHYQSEMKMSFPFPEQYFLEISCLYRESGLAMRSWFENWSFATDFNMNLVDRKEIWKLKFVGPDVSLNISISEKYDSPTYIYYANFQFNQKF